MYMLMRQLIYMTLRDSSCDTSHWHCHTAIKLLNMLIPNFENKADMADNLNNFCALVCLHSMTSSN